MLLKRFLSRRLAVALLASAFFVGCGSDLVQPPGTNPSISISLSNASLTIEQGEDGTVTVTLTRAGGFEGSVTISAEGLPSGVTAPSLTLASGQTSATMTLTSTQAAVVGTASLTVRATGTGVTDATATLALEVTAIPTGGFTLAASPTAISVEAGNSGTTSVTVTREAPFTGAVALSASGLPAGVTASFDPASVTGTSANLSLDVAGTVAAGDYPITINGTGVGVDAQMTTVTLTVTSTSSGGGEFALALAPDAISVQQNQNGAVQAMITRTSPFAGPVALAITGMPGGVTATADPASVTGDASTITIAASAGAPVGVHTLTVTGTGEGVADQTATLTVTVTAAPAGANFSWTFCPVTPTFFAVKDGAGPWQPVTATGNRFDFSVGSATAGVAYVTVVDGAPTLNIKYGAKEELEALGQALCPGTRSLSGTAAGVGALGTAYVSIGGASAVVAGATGPGFAVQNVRDGVVDAFGSLTTLDLATVSFVAEKLVIQRDLNPADGGTVDLDFAGGTAFATPSVTATGLNGEGALLTMVYRTMGTQGILFTETAYTGAATRTFPAVPASIQEASDMHLLTLTTQPDGGLLGSFRSASLYFNAPTDRNVGFGSALGGTTFTTPASAPYVMPRVQYMRQAEYDKYWNITYQQQAGGVSRNVIVYVTVGFQGGADIDYTLPDFSGVAGWDNSFGLAAGTEVTYSFVTSGWTGPGGIVPITITDGLEIMTASRTGMFTPN